MQSQIDEGAALLRSTAVEIRERVRRLVSQDLEFLANAPVFRDYLAGNPQTRAQVRDLWQSFIDHVPEGYYRQLCWWAANGEALIGVARTGQPGNCTALWQDDLAAPGQSAIFEKGLYISAARVSLGGDPQAASGTGRQTYARPVFAANVGGAGVVAIEIDTAFLLSGRQGPYRLWLTDGGGQLVSGNAEPLVVGAAADARLAKLVSELEAGPAATAFTLTNGTENRGLWQLSKVELDQDSGTAWYLVSYLPVDQYAPVLSDYAAQAAGTAALPLLFVCLICWYLLAAGGRRSRHFRDHAKRAELETQLGLFRRMVESLSCPFFLATPPDGKFAYVNDAMVELLGASKQEVLASRMADYDPAFLSKNMNADSLRGLLGRQVSRERQLRLADGSQRSVEVTSNIIPYGDGFALFGLVKDLTPLKAYEHSLIEARDAANASSRAKSRFLSFMSHELRTPLNAILGFCQLLELDGKKLAKEHKDYVDEIMVSGQLLLSLINDILDIVKIGSGKLHVESEVVDVTSVVCESVRMTRKMAEKAQIELVLGKSIDSAPDVLGDHVRLKQVLINLIHNAIKYNNKGGKVLIEVSLLQDGELRLSVFDTGIGIRRDRQADMFVSFERLGMEETNIEGTGIGLIIAKTLVELMSGTLGFSSVYGKGSHFWINMPLAGGVCKPLRRQATKGGESRNDQIMSIFNSVSCAR